MRASHTRPTPKRARRCVTRAAPLALALIFLALGPASAQDPAPKKSPELAPERPPAAAEAEPHPFSVTVEIRANRVVRLNGEGAGTTDDTGELVRRLKAVFAARERERAYAPGMEARADLPLEKRIARGVLIKSPRTTTYAEVVRVIDAVKGAGGDPVGLEVVEDATERRRPKRPARRTRKKSK